MMKALAMILVMLLPALASAKPSTPAEIRAELAKRTYKTQTMLDGSTAVWEHRPGRVRRVAPENHSYIRWLAMGRKTAVLPDQKPRPRPQMTATQLSRMLAEQTAGEAGALAGCQADVLLGVAIDCTAAAEQLQMARDAADALIRARVEVVR